MTRPVVILGGASGTNVSEALRDIDEDGGGLICAGFLNDALPVGFEVSGYPVLGPFDAWNDLSDETLFIGVLHKAKQAPERRARIAALGIPEARWAIVRHPSATIARDVAVGPGSYIGPHTVVMPGAAIGCHASLRPGCSIGHDTKLGEFVFVGPNATLNGNCVVEDGVHIGPNAVIHEETQIGATSVIGMGSVVLDDVPALTLMAGNPARAIRRYDVSGKWTRVGG